MPMRLALFQPEIPQNVGTLLRFGACMGVPIDIIEPCGFLLSDKRLKRSGMDYFELKNLSCIPSWKSYIEKNVSSRLIAITPNTKCTYNVFNFLPNDILVMGQESTGFPEGVLKTCSHHVAIPMIQSSRSLNVAIAAAIVTTEALRQTQQLPGDST